MSRKFFSSLLLALTLGSASIYAAEPTLHEVYQAAQNGNYAAAERMMDQVLQDHPNSAKAHFVQAELLARQGKGSAARSELARAESLDPGLGFATPSAVSELRAQLTAPTHTAVAHAAAVQPAASFPWGLLLAGGALIAAIVFFVTRRRNVAEVIPAGHPYPANGYGNGYGNGGYASNWGNSPTPMAPNGGMGSGILGGLATGAAVGAGMVAGEALMHRMMGDGARDHYDSLANPVNADPNDAWGNSLGPDSAYDMGGQDFGVSDGGSWDDSSGGGSDWS